MKTQKCYKVNKGVYDAVLMEEGTYYLERIHYDRFGSLGNGYYNKKTSKATMLQFTIKNGEVIYIGDIRNILFAQGGLKLAIIYIYISNSFPQAKQYLEDNYPNIDAERLEYRPLEIGTEAEPMTEEIRKQYGIEK